MSVAAAKFFWGPLAQPFHPPAVLSGQIELGCREFPTYRSFLIAVRRGAGDACCGSASSARASARRSAPPSTTAAWRSRSASTPRSSSRSTFALGSGLAALGGALGAEILAIEPGYALEHLVYFLIVVSVGGLGTIRGPFFAALLLGIADTGFKYLLPEFGAFFIYALTLVDPAVAAARPVRPRMTADRAPRIAAASAIDVFARRHRLRGLEALPWLVAIAAYFVFPDYLALGAQILATILFALSLDLMLGYAGIVTLGHAAFFGTGAYTAGLLAAHGWGEPISGLVVAASAPALVGLRRAARSSCARAA